MSQFLLPARLLTPVVALALASVAPRVGAVDPRNHQPAASAGAVLGLDTTWVAPPLRPFVALDLAYANDELVVVGPSQTSLLHTRLVASLVAGVTLVAPLELAVAVPLQVVDGDGERATGMGDVRVAAKLRIVAPADDAGGVGLALDVGLGLPTGGAAPFSSDDGVSLDPRLVLDWRGRRGGVVALSVGYRHRPRGEIAGLVVGGELRYGLATELPLDALGAAGVPLALLGEVEGAVGVEDPGSALQRPFEARFGLRVRTGRWAFTLASATGVSSGYGAPDYRVMAGVRFGDAPAAAPPEPGVAGPVDDGPEPTFAGAGAAPLDAAALANLVVDDPDADIDGVPRGVDRCPEDPEDEDRFEDEDGCPDPDNDSDGVADAADRCPAEKEVVNGVKDDDGCADAVEDVGGDPRHPRPGVTNGPAILADGLIALPGVIEFNPGSDVLQAAADRVIAQLATFVLAHPEVKRIRIEGHTDDRGDEEFNVDLSERRAARVRMALIKKGVAHDRLMPKGFGPTRPLSANTSNKARASNRRVEIRIVDPAPGVPPPGSEPPAGAVAPVPAAPSPSPTGGPP